MADPDERRRLEPWPIGLAAALLAMIAVCLVFFAIASTHADVELIREGERPGLALPGEAPESGGGRDGGG